MKELSPTAREGWHPHSAKGGSWEDNLGVIPSRVSGLAQEGSGKGSLTTQDPAKPILQPGNNGVTSTVTKPINRITLGSSQETLRYNILSNSPTMDVLVKVIGNFLVIVIIIIIIIIGKLMMSSQRTIPCESFIDAITKWTREDDLCWSVLTQG